MYMIHRVNGKIAYLSADTLRPHRLRFVLMTLRALGSLVFSCTPVLSDREMKTLSSYMDASILFGSSCAKPRRDILRSVGYSILPSGTVHGTWWCLVSPSSFKIYLALPGNYLSSAPKPNFLEYRKECRYAK